MGVEQSRRVRGAERILVPVLATMLWLGGCMAPGESADQAYATRDSAGVEIVQVAAPTQQWQVSEQPLLRIGVVEGEPAYLLSQVWFAGRLSDGRIVVADRATSEIRYFGPDGRHVATVGRQGQGPGEFVRFGDIRLGPQDTIWVRDAGIARITVVSPAPEVAREYPVESMDQGTGLRFVGPLSSNRITVTTDVNRLPRRDLDSEVSYNIRDSLTVSIVDLESLDAMPVAALPTTERFFPRQTRADVSRSRMGFSLPFRYDGLSSVVGEAIVLVRSEYPEVRIRDNRGRLVRILRLEHEPIPLTAELRARDLEWTVEEARANEEPDPLEEGRERQAQLDVVPAEHIVPYFDALLTDMSGRIWLRDYRHPWESDTPQIWTVYEDIGQPVARVEIPGGISVTHVDAEHVVGVVRDEYDVEYVVVHRIEGTP